MPSELLCVIDEAAALDEMPGSITTVFDGITETRRYNILWDWYDFRWDCVLNGEEHHIFRTLFPSEIQDAGGLDSALERMRDQVKNDFKVFSLTKYPSYINKSVATPDFQSIPEHPAYVAIKPADISAGASSVLGAKIPHEGMKRLIEEMNKMFPAQPVIPTAADTLPPFLTPAPSTPPQAEEKGWQPDQINDSLMKGRIRDW